MQQLLMLEDSEARIAAFRAAVEQLLEIDLLAWRTAYSMIADLPHHLPAAALISLDHDLVPADGDARDPGTGMEVCEFLVKQKPICPVVIHSTNYPRCWSMINEFTYADWNVHRAAPFGMGEDWIFTSWLPRVRLLLVNHERKN